MNRSLILGSVGVAIGAAALGLTFFVDDEQPKEAAAVLKAPAPTAGVGLPVSDSPAKRIVATQPDILAAPRASVSPSFDVVRVNPRGDAVIAGRAQPNAHVIVRDGRKEVGRAKADARGEWVVVPKEPLSAGNRELTLSSESRTGETKKSEKNVVIVVPERKNSPDTGALAVLVPRDGKGESRVMQKPSDSLPNGAGAPGKPAVISLSIDAVDYDESGNVTISGSARADVRLNIYIENKFSGSGKADSKGRWRLVPGGALSPGLYTLRVDQVDGGGKVLERAETQFTRAKPAKSSSRQTVVFVEPGNSLWRIARRVYGRGMQYTVIFDANRQQIRNPDLIYPGQVFFVPHVN